MGERRRGESGEPGTAFPVEPEEPNSLLQRAVAVLQSSSLHGFQHSKAVLLEKELFLSQLQSKGAAGGSQEGLQETVTLLLLDQHHEVFQSGILLNSSSFCTLADSNKGIYISKYSDCLQPRPWHHGKSGYVVICKLIKGKVRAMAESSSGSSACPFPGHECHPCPRPARDSSQYYVYEVSGGSAAQRLRQVCPYIFLHREHKDTPLLQPLHELVERNYQVPYCPWRGQLSIQGRLLCSIALRSPYSCTVPAQLPPNLDIKHVMGLSDLKKKLPEAAFGKKNYTRNEVCFQGIYSSLYEVEISNKDKSKMDQLVENLKEKDVAIIKYLEDQGILILLTSSALAREDGLEPKEPVSLLALFLFLSPRALGPRVGKQDPRDGKGGSARSAISLKISSVLPGLRYALREAANSSGNSTGSTCIQEHLREYSRLQECSQPASIPFPSQDEGAHPSQKLWEPSLAQLRRYLHDPSDYTLGIPAALECLRGAGSNLGAAPRDSSSSAALNPALERWTKSVTSPTKPWGRDSRRKSSRSVRKNPNPAAPKARARPGDAGSGSREAAKSKATAAPPVATKSGSAGTSSQAMLKLANLQLPHGRKRGAEVLAAEIVLKPQCEAAEKEIPAPGAPGVEAKRPKTLENLDLDKRKIPLAESATKAGKNKMQKTMENKASKAPEKQQEGNEPPSAASPQSQSSEILRNGIDPAQIPRDGIDAAEIPRDGIDPTQIPRNGIDPAEIPRDEVDPAEIPRNGIDPAEILRNGIDPAEIPRDGFYPAQIPRNGVDPTQTPRDGDGINPSEIPRNGIDPAQIPRNGVYPTQIPSNGVDPSDIPRNGVDPAQIPRDGDGINPTQIPRNGVYPTQIPRNGDGVYPAEIPRNGVDPTEIPRNGVYPVAIPAGCTLPGDTCEPHALNLLADLALSSCIPAFIPKNCGIVALPGSPQGSGDSLEQQNLSSPKSPLRVASDHKYHRADKQGKRSSSSGVSLIQELPEKTDSSPPGEKKSGMFSRSSVNPSPALFQVFPPREAPEVNPHSIISAEHSYASPMPEDPGKSPDPKGNPNPGRALPKTTSRNVAAAPLVGKVLPFWHQQSRASEPTRSRSSLRKKEDFSKSHTVNFWGDSMKITCRWKGKYLFHLDSRYTSNSLEKAVVRALHGPWDPNLPDDVEGMKLILHMWVALFYRKPSKLLNSSRKVVEHINPKKFVSINSSSGFLELSDDSQDCFGFETCPADSGSDPDQTPSSSQDPSTPSQGASQPEKSAADSQTDADGAPGAVDSTVSSSSGELPCGEEEPSSTSCPESLSLQEHSREKRDVAGRGQEVVPKEEPVKEDLLDAEITPSPSEELGCPTKFPENLGSQAPNSSTAPCTDTPCAPQDKGERQENQQEAGSGSGPGPPEDEEGMGDSGHSLGAEDGADPQPACDSMPSQANPGRAEPGGAAEEGEQSQEPPERPEKEERREMEEEKEEELEDELPFMGPMDLVPSESSDAEMECEQNPGNWVSPAELGAPEEDPVPPSPSSLASPCPHRSSPALSPGATPDPGAFPEETSQNQDELPDPWDAPARPDLETDGAGVPSPSEVGSPHNDCGELPCPTEPGLGHGAQPDSVTDSPGLAGDTGHGSEQKIRDPAPSGERWEPAGSAECPCGQGVALTPCPDSSSPCLTSPDGCADPWAAPEDQHEDGTWSPSQSDLGRSSCCSQLGLGEADPSLNCLDAEESNQGGNGLLLEEQQGSLSAICREELDDPMGAGDGRDSPLDCAETGHDCRAEQREDGAENSSGNDTVEIPDYHHLLESEPSSREISAIKELPRQQQSIPNIHSDSAPASPGAGGSNPGVPAVRESVLCRLWKPCREGGAAQVSVAAWSLDGSFHPSFSQDLMEPPAPRSPVGSTLPSLCDPWDDLEASEPGSPLPEGLSGVLPLTPDNSRWSGSCGSPGSQAGDARGSPSQEPFSPEDLEAGSIPSPAPFPARECPVWEHNPEGCRASPDPNCAEVGEGEIPASPIPASPWDQHGEPSIENLEFSDAEDISDVLPSQDTQEDLAFEDPLENSFGDSDQEYFEGNSRSPLPSRSFCIMRSMDAAGARTNRNSSSRSSLSMQEHGQDWDRETPGDSRSFVVTRQCQERMENFQFPKRRSHRTRESHLVRSLLGTWRGFEEITQNTLDMECLRFHYKLKEILRNGRPPFSTSKSIFPTAFFPRDAPILLSPRSRSPLQVTIAPSGTWPGRLQSHRGTRGSRRRRSRARSRDPRAPLRLGKLRYERAVPEPRGDVADILDEYSQFQRVVLDRAEARRDPLVQGEAGRGRVGPGQAGRTVPIQGMVSELCGALSSQLRRVAAGAQPGMFYLLETGKEPFFDRVKALLKAEGFVRTEPPDFCGAQRQDSERLLVVVRNEDISSHIHTVPCLLQLKHRPSVVFAGVDDPQDVTGDTFQELFQAGGFVVSDEELLERVTLGQLQEVMRMLERLNRNGRWKWLLHHRESKKLKGDLRDDANAQKKQLLLRCCQGEELLELLPFHGCDSSPAPESRRVQCLLELQVQHIHARFAVYLTENPGSSSRREILESKGILVADINTFLGTVQKVAAPFRRSYW